jgi:diacylglycerol O-acyltransferase / wax synthase
MDPRMGAFDAVMFGVEKDPILRSVITLVVELQSAPDPDRLRYRVDRMTRIVEPLRHRAVGNSVSLAPPRWEVDPNFNLDYHLRTVMLPNATMPELLEHVSSWAEQDFDRARPLWEMSLYTHLAGGRAALAVKIHHAITDGVGGIQLAASLLDLTEDSSDPEDMPEAPAAEAAGWTERLEQGAQFEITSIARDTADAAKSLLGMGRELLTDPGGSLLAAQEFVGSATRVLAPADEPLSPLMKKRSLSVWFGELSVDFADIRAAGKAAGGSVNDAFVAAVLGGMRSYHEHFGDVPDELRMHMPINRRTTDNTAGGNQWIPARFPVPLNEADAARRIRQLHPILVQAREEPALAVSGQVYKVLMTLPRAITTRIAGGLMKGTDVVATNVPGPPIPVYMAGAKVTRMIPFAPKGGAAVNVGLMSYDGRAEIGVNVDTEAVSNPELLLDCLRQSFADVVATTQSDTD